MRDEILIVDDEIEIADLLEVYLINEGYKTKKINNGSEALELIKKEEFSLVLLDIMLPDVDGFKICREIRKEHYYPVIMLTAKVEDIDKINGLTVGADDYITKPFNSLEVIARVKTQLRRFTTYNGHKEEVLNNQYDIRGLNINKDTHSCNLYGSKLDLTPKEFSILLYFCENQGKVVTSEELFEHIWKENYLDNNNTVMAHIARLREKMKDNGKDQKFIKTIWGVGYKID